MSLYSSTLVTEEDSLMMFALLHPVRSGPSRSLEILHLKSIRCGKLR